LRRTTRAQLSPEKARRVVAGLLARVQARRESTKQQPRPSPPERTAPESTSRSYRSSGRKEKV
jgi:hypothetical protein